MAMPMFTDGAAVSKEILESKASSLKIQPGSTVTLFAVWEDYELPEDSQEYTTMKVVCENSSVELSAVSSSEFADGAKPAGTLIVDYGDG